MFQNEGGRHPRGRFARGEFGFRGFGGGRHHARRGRRSHGRIFDHGDLRFVILQLIADSPKHGYEIIKAIEDKLGGAYSPSPGVVYPTLTLLEELGYVTLSASEGSKKLYAITHEGVDYLDFNRETVAAIFARIAKANSIHGDGPAPQIVRAMENLTLALRFRLSRGPLSQGENDAVAEALDAAAVAVERS